MRLINCVLVLMPVLASAQVQPTRVYNRVKAPLWVTVSMPRGVSGSMEIALLSAGTAEIEAKALVRPGRADLSKIFPILYLLKQPKTVYAQLLVDGKKIGPALVLQPMLNPPISRLAADGKTVEFVPDEDGPMFNGYRTYVDQNFVVETNFGKMEFRLRPDAAPNTVWNLRELAKGGLYTDTIFHRVVAKRADGTPFVIQGGDPTGTGSGGAGWAYPLEDSTLPHAFGVISIARSTDPNTNGCQIFVALSRAGTKHLDHRYAAFGECIRGGDVILKIGAVPVGKEDRPLDPPKILKVRLVDAAPYGEGPDLAKRPDGQP